MFRDKYRQQITWGITVFILLFMAIACYFLFLRWGNVVKGWNTISGILAPVSFGLIIAYLLDSLVSAFIHLFERIPLPARANKARWGKVYRALSIVASEVIFVLVIALLISSIIPQIIDSLMTIISNIDTYAANLEAWSTPLLEDYPAVKPYVLEQFKAAETFVTDFLKNDLLSVITRVTSGLFEVGTYVYNFIIGLIVSISIQPWTSQWMDVVSIYICPLGAALAGVMFFWVLSKKSALEEVNNGAKKPIGSWFYPLGKYVYIPLSLAALVLGIIYGGIG